MCLFSLVCLIIHNKTHKADAAVCVCFVSFVSVGATTYVLICHFILGQHENNYCTTCNHNKAVGWGVDEID